MTETSYKPEKFTYHRFLDEAGDTAFYGRGKTPIIGSEGVSRCFMLGMIEFKEPLPDVRWRVKELQSAVATDPYFRDVPSIQKKIAGADFFVHAKDDVPEVRKMVFELIASVNCRFEAIVGRKIYTLYERKHNGREAEFYADLLSHLLRDKLNDHQRLVLNLAHRSRCTTHQNLNTGLKKAVDIAGNRYPEACNCCQVDFNVQYPTDEPLLNLADYFCWAVQRVFERGETRYYDFVKDKISGILDLYDGEEGDGRLYTADDPLTKGNQLK